MHDCGVDGGLPQGLDLFGSDPGNHRVGLRLEVEGALKRAGQKSLQYNPKMNVFTDATASLTLASSLAGQSQWLQLQRRKCIFSVTLRQLDEPNGHPGGKDQHFSRCLTSW